MTATRPSRLPSTGLRAPDGRDFPWGPVQAIHTVGDIQVVEYLADRSNWPQESTWAEHGQARFQPYVDGRDTGHGYHSLDSALVGAIAHKRSGPNSQAARHFDLMTLGTVPDEA